MPWYRTSSGIRGEVAVPNKHEHTVCFLKFVCQSIISGCIVVVKEGSDDQIGFAMDDDNDDREYMHAIHRFGISRCYDAAELHEAYRRLVRETHPDRAIDDADRQRRMQGMISINQTYRYLRRMVGTFDADSEPTIADDVVNEPVDNVTTYDVKTPSDDGIPNGVSENGNSTDNVIEDATSDNGVRYAYTSDESVTMQERPEHSFKEGVASFVKAGQERLDITWMHTVVIVVGIIAMLTLSVIENYLALFCVALVLVEFGTRVVSKSITAMINVVRHIMFNVIIPFFDTVFYGIRFIGSSVNRK